MYIYMYEGYHQYSIHDEEEGPWSSCMGSDNGYNGEGKGEDKVPTN